MYVCSAQTPTSDYFYWNQFRHRHQRVVCFIIWFHPKLRICIMDTNTYPKNSTVTNSLARFGESERKKKSNWMSHTFASDFRLFSSFFPPSWTTFFCQSIATRLIFRDSEEKNLNCIKPRRNLLNASLSENLFHVLLFIDPTHHRLMFM